MSDFVKDSLIETLALLLHQQDMIGHSRKWIDLTEPERERYREIARGNKPLVSTKITFLNK